MTLACLDISSKKSAYRDFLHIILKHTQKQQAGNKSICTEERGEKLLQLQICFQISEKTTNFSLLVVYQRSSPKFTALTHVGPDLAGHQ